MINESQATIRREDLAGIAAKLAALSSGAEDTQVTDLQRSAMELAALSGTNGEVASSDLRCAGAPQPVKNWEWGWPF